MNTGHSFSSLGKLLSVGAAHSPGTGAQQVPGASAGSQASSSLQAGSSAQGEFAGWQVQRIERKSSSDRIDETAGPHESAPMQSAATALRGMVREQSAFQRLSRHFEALPSTLGFAVSDTGSARKVREQASQALDACAPLAFEARAFPAFCHELQLLEGVEPGVCALLAGAFAAEAGIATLGAQARISFIDGAIKSAILARSPDSALRAVDVLFAVGEALAPAGRFINGGFLRLIVPHLLANASSPQPLRMFEHLASVCLGVAPPPALALALRLLLDSPSFNSVQRADRLGRLAEGLARAQPPTSDQHLRVLLRSVMREGRPAADFNALASAVARTPLWERFTAPGVLEPHELGHLMLASASASLQADRKAAVIHLDDDEPAIETKAGPVHYGQGASARDAVALVRALPLSTHRGEEGRLAREILSVHRALEGSADAARVRDALRQRILDAAPHAHHLSLVAMACGWGLAEGATGTDKAQFRSLCASLRVPVTPASWSGVANDAFVLGLQAARHIDGVGADAARPAEGRVAVAQVRAEAEGLLTERQLAERLQQIPGLELPPLVAAGWLDALIVHGFQGADLDPLRTARAMLTGYAQSIADPASPVGDEPAQRARALSLVGEFVTRMHALAHQRFAQRHDQGLWLTDSRERDAVFAMARDTKEWLQEEVVHFTSDEPPQALKLAVTDPLLAFEESVLAAIERMNRRAPDPRYAQDF